MKWRLILPVIVLALLACNLTTQPRATAPVVTETAPATFTVPATVTPLGLPSQPTLPPPPVPVAATSASGTLCPLYITYSGIDPDNQLSLRAEPRTTATQLYKLPNNAEVFLVPGSTEVEAEGYHWLNIVYVDSSQTRYVGWTARDSFSQNGVRDPSIATLRPTGRQAPC